MPRNIPLSPADTGSALRYPHRDAASGTALRRRELAAAAIFAAIVLAVHLTIVLTGISPVLQGELVDTDGYMRALRVERLLETGAWFDGTEPRSNAPYGETSHWTRPYDLVASLVAVPLAPFLDIDEAVFAAAVVVPPVLALLLYLGTGWAVRPFVGAMVALMVPPAVLAQPMVAMYSLPGRSDHHPLILLFFVLSLGHLLRASREARDGRHGILAGLLAGAGLWVSTEFLAPLALFFAGLTLGWILRGGGWAKTGLRFSVSLCAAVVAGVLIEHGAAAVSAVEYDRLSLPHVLMTILAMGFWAATVGLDARVASWRGRLLLAGGGALIAGGSLSLAFPPFLGGPWAEVDPAVADLWLRHVRELQPLAGGTGRASAGWLLLYLGPVLVALPWFAKRALAARKTADFPGWLVLGIGLAGFTLLALLQRRWATYAEVLGAVGLVGALVPAVRRLGRIRVAAIRVVARAAVLGVALLGFQLVGGGLLVARAPGASGAVVGTSSGCALDPALESLDSADRPRTILAFLDFGPEILYRSPHRVVATPYHRNEGIADSYRILSTLTPDQARRAMATREVDVILICPGRDRSFFARRSTSTTGPSLYARLTRGDPPGWLRRLPLPVGSGFLAWEVVD